MEKEANIGGSANSLGKIIKDIRQKAKANSLFISGLKIFVNFGLEQLKKFVRSKQILKLISDGYIYLHTTGTEEFESIWDSRDEFKYFDEKFASHAKAYTRGLRPKSIKANIYELASHGTLSSMIGSFGEDLYLLSLTQHEILEFIRHRKEYLTTATFFLFKSGHDSDANFHVAQVMSHKEGGISIGLVGLAFECGLLPKERRIVVRQPEARDIDVELFS